MSSYVSHPIEELRENLVRFVEQDEHPLLVLTSFDEEIPTIVRTVDHLDGSLPSDVVFPHVDPIGALDVFVEGLIVAVQTQISEVNAERVAVGRLPLLPPPDELREHRLPPEDRIKGLIAHMSGWLPEGDHRLVWVLLPERILDQTAYARVVGAILGTDRSVLRRFRAVVREDRNAQFLRAALVRAGHHRALHAWSTVTVGDFADAIARKVGDRTAPPAIRMNALLQCALLDHALGRYEAAIEKFAQLFAYYDEHRVPELAALVVKSVGDVLMRVSRTSAARDKYLQALDIASDCGSLMLIFQAASALGELASASRGWAEADTSFTLAADSAEKLGFAHACADALDRAGLARAHLGELNRAVVAWTKSANVARESDYATRLAEVLSRLRDVARNANYPDVAATYESERAYVAATGRCL
jgi:tetratricopeptide (TPR) repeat protein